MKRLTVILAAALLALAPAAAEAKAGGNAQAYAARAGKPVVKKARKAKKGAARTAAAQCRTERGKLGPHRFRTKYGRAAAMGQCVKAARSRAALAEKRKVNDDDSATDDDVSGDDESGDDTDLAADDDASDDDATDADSASDDDAADDPSADESSDDDLV